VEAQLAGAKMGKVFLSDTNLLRKGKGNKWKRRMRGKENLRVEDALGPAGMENQPDERKKNQVLV